MRRVLVILALCIAGLVAAVTTYALWLSQATNQARASALALPAATAPTVSMSGSNATLSWTQVSFAGSPMGTYSSGGYLVRRYAEGSSVPITPGAGCSSLISGAGSTLGCTENSVPGGTWHYTVRAALGNWRGTESPQSSAPPSNSLSLVGQTGGGSFLSGTALYYQGTAAGGGSFRIQNAVTSASSTPASSDFAAFGGTSTGWTHATPDHQTTPAGGPYVSNLFTWASGTTSAPTEGVTGGDTPGNQTTTTLSFVDDSTAPSGGALTVNGVAGSSGGTSSFNKTGSFPIDARTDHTDGGSGLATSILTVRFAPFSGTACGTFGSATVINGAPPQTVTSGDGCYEYKLEGTDHVGNKAHTTTTVHVDQTAPVTTDNTATIGNGWHNTNQTVTLTPADSPGTGVAQTYYTTDGSTPTTSSATGTSISLTATGVYTVKYFSVDNAGNQEVVKTAGTQIRIDKTNPADSLGLSSASAAYLSGLNLYFNTNTGGSFRLVDAVTDNDSGPASATFPGINNSGWSGHTASELVSSGTGSAPTISYTSSLYTFGVGANTPNGSASTRVTSADVATNASSGATLNFIPDAAATAPTITFPVTTSSYNNSTWNAGCSSAICGSASDAGSGLLKVDVSIQQGVGNYWNGSGFSSGTQVWNLATGTTSWSFPFAASSFPAEGSYAIVARVTDEVGNTATTNASITIDRTSPTATNVVLANGGVATKADKGDTVTITYSETMDALSFCSGWANGSTQTKSGSAGGVVVTISDAGTSDTLSSVTASGCTFHFGSVALGANYVSTTSTFSGNGSNASSVSWTPAARTLTITLGAVASGTQNTAILPSTPSYSPDVTLKDLAGNTIGAGPFAGSLSAF